MLVRSSKFARKSSDSKKTASTDFDTTTFSVIVLERRDNLSDCRTIRTMRLSGGFVEHDSTV